jgi:hypothetical protein
MKHLNNTQKQKEPYMMKRLLNSVQDFTRRQKKKHKCLQTIWPKMMIDHYTAAYFEHSAEGITTLM